MMLKMILKKINNFSTLFFLSTYFLISFHFLIRDALFFYSQQAYILYYLFISSFLIFFFLFFSFNFFSKIENISANSIKFLLFFTFLNFFRSIFFLLENQINSALIELIIFFISILLSIVILSKIDFKKITAGKFFFVFSLFSNFFFLLMFLIFLNLIYFNHFKSIELVNKKNPPVVLIIIDGLPKTYIKNFSKNINDISIVNDSLKDKYVVQNYHKFISPAPWTCGFFANLYGISQVDSFKRNPELKEVLSSKKNEENFFNKLDKLNISYNWSVSHSCAVPEGTAASISNYKGLKSILSFSTFYKIYLKKIGLPSHSIININDFKGEPTPVHVKNSSVLSKIINFFQSPGTDAYNFKDNIFNSLNFADSNFNIIHLNYSNWKNKELDNFKKPIDELIKEVNNFFEIIQNKSNFDDINFIITADHGFSFDKNDFAYGTAYSAEVVETPFVIIQKKKLNIKNEYNNYQPCSIIDMQNSLLDYYKKSKFSFSIECSKIKKTSFSYPDHKKKTWMLTIYDGERKSLYNFYHQYFNKNYKIISSERKLKYFSSFIDMYGIKKIEHINIK